MRCSSAWGWGRVRRYCVVWMRIAKPAVYEEDIEAEDGIVLKVIKH